MSPFHFRFLHRRFLTSAKDKQVTMLEHLIHVNTWFPKYEVDLAEQTHFKAFVRVPRRFILRSCSPLHHSRARS